MSRTSIYLACLAAAFVLCGSIARGQENQIVNGEFDDGLNGWGRYGAAGFTIEVVHGAGLSGSNAAVFDVTDASATTMIGLPQSGLLLEPGVTYPIGFTARAEQDREMVVLIQTNRNNASWFDQLTQRVQLTTQAQAFVLEYTHSGDALGDEAGETVTLYLMLKGSLWPMTGDALNKKVWLDRVYVGAEPPVQERGQAAVPTPEDGALHEATWVSLQWLPGDFAVSHDVYIGDNFDDVNEGLADTFRGNQPATNYVAGFPGYAYADGLVPGTTYYWRIDEVNDADPNSPWKGNVWSFTVPPRIAYAPNPPDGDKFADPAAILEWKPGLDAKLHAIHFGDSFDDIANAGPGVPQSPMTFDPGTLEREKTYYWRVDEFDGTNTVTGDVWSFTVAKDGGGLKGEYFSNRSLSGDPVLTRVDPQIDFDWGGGDVPGENSPDAGIAVDEFSARWSGELEVDITDAYTFSIGANNGFRLFLDGQLIIDYWD
ncbi:MAG: PA14 domain-containing protein, partial [Planctomycetota bacterium]